MANKDEHDCIQEKRLERIESDLEKEAQKHEDLTKAINGKLDKIWKTMNTQDNQIRSQLTSNIITICLGFVSAIIGALGVILWLK